jgi:uncharacterized protein YjbI with pentapeptide repeats
MATGASRGPPRSSPGRFAGGKPSWFFLQEADLSRANLCDANLFIATLNDAMLEEALLTQANLGKASLDRVNLKLADACFANFHQHYSGTCLRGGEGKHTPRLKK